MKTRRTGAWLIGSRGSVATTTITGAAAIAAGLAPATGVVTMGPPFADAGLPGLDEIPTLSGCELVQIVVVRRLLVGRTLIRRRLVGRGVVV